MSPPPIVVLARVCSPIDGHAVVRCEPRDASPTFSDFLLANGALVYARGDIPPARTDDLYQAILVPSVASIGWVKVSVLRFDVPTAATSSASPSANDAAASAGVPAGSGTSKLLSASSSADSIAPGSYPTPSSSAPGSPEVTPPIVPSTTTAASPLLVSGHASSSSSISSGASSDSEGASVADALRGLVDEDAALPAHRMISGASAPSLSTVLFAAQYHQHEGDTTRDMGLLWNTPTTQTDIANSNTNKTPLSRLASASAPQLYPSPWATSSSSPRGSAGDTTLAAAGTGTAATSGITSSGQGLYPNPYGESSSPRMGSSSGTATTSLFTAAKGSLYPSAGGSGDQFQISSSGGLYPSADTNSNTTLTAAGQTQLRTGGFGAGAHNKVPPRPVLALSGLHAAASEPELQIPRRVVSRPIPSRKGAGVDTAGPLYVNHSAAEAAHHARTLSAPAVATVSVGPGEEGAKGKSSTQQSWLKVCVSHNRNAVRALLVRVHNLNIKRTRAFTGRSIASASDR